MSIWLNRKDQKKDKIDLQVVCLGLQLEKRVSAQNVSMNTFSELISDPIVTQMWKARIILKCFKLFIVKYCLTQLRPFFAGIISFLLYLSTSQVFAYRENNRFVQARPSQLRFIKPQKVEIQILIIHWFQRSPQFSKLQPLHESF
ncbi:Hypothetical_protein [Hexamita inflata]|uniref:Hypothetical_protein n=1 Tax=Hexamita inflata TaxID=28002 RepID=A0AA86QAY4_9EUKA|nr:Hypothetical protein HINF_LOCUS43296 [Hexamita inflata]